jgi:hypothetical protein
VVAGVAPGVQAAGQQAAPAAGAGGDRSLAVTVTYKGKGEVSATNEVSIFLFDTPVINEQSMPIGVETLVKNGGTVTFQALPVDTVYIAVVYDEKGIYDREGPPPTGTPVAIHGDQGGAATGVKTGKDAKVSITFDDTTRMP